MSSSEDLERKKSPSGEDDSRTEAETCRTGRKLCKTLDLAEVDVNQNLYTMIRQHLHKVNRVSSSSLPPLKRSNSDGDGRSGVYPESSVGRFSAIKAFFDRDNRSKPVEHRTTIMGKLIRSFGLRRQNSRSCSDALDSGADDIDINGNQEMEAHEKRAYPSATLPRARQTGV